MAEDTMIEMVNNKKATEANLYNHPLLPILVYEFYRDNNKDKEYFGRERPITRNQWAWYVIECKEYVAERLGVSGDEFDIILFENNTIEATLFILFSMDGRKFEDGTVPDDFER